MSNDTKKYTDTVVVTSQKHSDKINHSRAGRNFLSNIQNATRSSPSRRQRLIKPITQLLQWGFEQLRLRIHHSYSYPLLTIGVVLLSGVFLTAFMLTDGFGVFSTGPNIPLQIPFFVILLGYLSGPLAISSGIVMLYVWGQSSSAGVAITRSESTPLIKHTIAHTRAGDTTGMITTAHVNLADLPYETQQPADVEQTIPIADDPAVDEVLAVNYRREIDRQLSADGSSNVGLDSLPCGIVDTVADLTCPWVVEVSVIEPTELRASTPDTDASVTQRVDGARVTLRVLAFVAASEREAVHQTLASLPTKRVADSNIGYGEVHTLAQADDPEACHGGVYDRTSLAPSATTGDETGSRIIDRTPKWRYDMGVTADELLALTTLPRGESAVVDRTLDTAFGGPARSPPEIAQDDDHTDT